MKTLVVIACLFSASCIPGVRLEMRVPVGGMEIPIIIEK